MCWNKTKKKVERGWSADDVHALHSSVSSSSFRYYETFSTSLIIARPASVTSWRNHSPPARYCELHNTKHKNLWTFLWLDASKVVLAIKGNWEVNKMFEKRRKTSQASATTLFKWSIENLNVFPLAAFGLKTRERRMFCQSESVTGRMENENRMLHRQRFKVALL